MSGELINVEKHVKKVDMFNKGFGNFSSQSINELFDANGDGETTGIEKELMMSGVVLNTINSIHPAVAATFQNQFFNLNNGGYLTKNMRDKDNKMMEGIARAMKAMDEKEQKEFEENDRMPTEDYNIDNVDDINGNLYDDLKLRRYLTNAEINNDV